MHKKRVFRWNGNLLNRLAEASTVNQQTIMNSVKSLAQTANIRLPKIHEETLLTPTPYCILHHLNLEKSKMERKQCLEKNCPSLTYVKKIFTYGDSE